MSLPDGDNNSQAALFIKAAPLIFILLWAGGFTFAKLGLNSAAPFTLLNMRFLFASIAFYGLYLIFKPAMPKTKKEWQHTITSGFLLQVVHFSCVYYAIVYGISAGGVAVITSMQPILIAILSPQITGEVITKRQWLGFLLGLSGALIVIVLQTEISYSSSLGIILSCAALFTMTTLTLYEKRFGGNQHPISMNLIQYIVGFVCTLILALIFEGYRYEASTELYLTLIYLVVGNSIIGVTLLLSMIKFGEASKVSSLFFLVPPIAAIYAWLLVDEVLSIWAWGGVALAAIGVSFVRAEKKP
ncbi:MAG: DMT family transporter [Rhodomicrobiaceae bacterium]